MCCKNNTWNVEKHFLSTISYRSTFYPILQVNLGKIISPREHERDDFRLKIKSMEQALDEKEEQRAELEDKVRILLLVLKLMVFEKKKKIL